MLPYILIFIFSSFLYFQNIGRKVGLSFYIFLATVILMSGLRDMIGGYDVYIYAEVYEAPIEAISGYEGFELGFRFFYTFLKFFSDNRHFMFFVSAMVIMILYFFAIKKYSPVVYFSLFLLFCKFFLMSFVYIRQGIALGIIWFSIPYILNKNYIKFTVLVVLAFLFHKSSIVFVPIYFISTIRLKPINMLAIAIVFLLLMLSPLSGILLSALAESTGDAKANLYASLSGDVNILYLIEVIVLIWLLLKYQKRFYETRYGTLIANGLFCYIIVNTMALTNASFIRFGWYYFFFLVLALPSIYTFIAEEKAKKLFKNIVFLYYALLFFRLLIVYDGGDFMPYKTIFEDFDRGSIWKSYEYR